MILKRTTALLLLIINFSFIVYHLALIFLLKERLIINPSIPPLQLQLPAWLLTQGLTVFFFAAIAIGFLLVLQKAKQAMWVIIISTLYFVMRLSFDVVAVLVVTNVTGAGYFGSAVVSIVNTLIFLGFVASMFFVKNRAIRLYYIWFGIIIFVTTAITPFARLLYNQYRVKWIYLLNLNPNITKIFPFAVTLALFFSLYQAAKKQNS